MAIHIGSVMQGFVTAWGTLGWVLFLIMFGSFLQGILGAFFGVIWENLC